MKLLIAGISLLILVACGGGGGATTSVASATSSILTVTGTGATGIAIAGATVTAKCKVGTGTAVTQADGSYSLPITDGQLPCVLQITNPVDGTKLHTVAFGTGSVANANITPLTEMATARVLGSEPNVFFAAFDVATATQKITSGTVQVAITDIGLVLAGTVDTTTLGNFISAPLTAATQGSPTSGDAQDKLLDALKLKLTAANVGTISTALANNQTTDAIKQTVTALTNVPTTPPIANAGTAQNVVAGTTVTLDASTSSASPGKSLTYAWTLASKPAGSSAVLSTSTAVKPTFVADVAGTYVASVIVNDGVANSSAVAVTITAAVANVAPVANAGIAQRIVTSAIVTLDASGSSDANGDPLTYAWTLTSKPSGSAAFLSSNASSMPTFSADLLGTYVATLVVNDGRLSSVAATTTVTFVDRIAGAMGISATDNYGNFCGINGQFTTISSNGSGTWTLSNCQVFGTAGSPLLVRIKNNGSTPIALTQIYVFNGTFGHTWSINPTSQTVAAGGVVDFALPLWLSLEVTNAIATVSITGEPNLVLPLSGSMSMP